MSTIVFDCKYRSLVDFYYSSTKNGGAVAASVAKRLFESEYPKFIEIYEALCENRYLPVETITNIHEKVSIINNYYADLSQYAENEQIKDLAPINSSMRLLSDSNLHTIFSLPTIPPDGQGLREHLYIPLCEAIKSLKKLGHAVDSWSYILTYLTLKKLSPQLRTLFEQCRTQSINEMPKFSEIMNFIDEQCRLQKNILAPDQDTTRLFSVEPTNPSLRFSHPFTSRGQHVPVAAVGPHSSYNQCLYCQRSHAINGCPEFLELSISSRKYWVRRHSYCFKCLGAHKSETCDISNICRICNEPYHNTLLCKTEPSVSHPRRSSPPTRTSRYRRSPSYTPKRPRRSSSPPPRTSTRRRSPSYASKRPRRSSRPRLSSRNDRALRASHRASNSPPPTIRDVNGTIIID